MVGMMAGMTSCAEISQPIVIEAEDPIHTEKPPTTPGSLWEPWNGRAYMFEDRRASRIGDIVIVQIVEQHRGSKSANTSADRESSVSSGLGGDLFGLYDVFDTVADVFDIETSSTNEFEGQGSTSREDTLTGTIAAKVTEVFPNGDLRIQGKREVTVNSERQTMTIRGIVRRIDLDTQNTVPSTAVAEAQITYTGLGVVDDVQRPGWAMRILDWVTPF